MRVPALIYIFIIGNNQLQRLSKIRSISYKGRIRMADDHHHHPHHDHDSPGELSFDEKIEKMLSHWIKHNEDHASNYRNWAQKAKANDMGKAAALLEAAADMSVAINEKFKEALALVNDDS